MIFLSIYVNLSKIAIGAGVFIFSWFLVVVLNGGYIPPGGGYGCQGGLLFFVGAFGG